MNNYSSVEAKTRYSNFPVQRIVDETFREGVERCMFPVDVERMYALFEKMVAAGLREFVVGSGPEDPALYNRICSARDSGQLPQDLLPTFLVLLNCWEATYTTFKNTAPSWIADTTFSFGMIPHRKEERLFEKVVSKFKDLGAVHLKASVLNNFARQVDTTQYNEIRSQIDWAYQLGIKTIRINDSVGKLYPETTAELCQQLLSDYPDIVFCLHCHNDRGLALANQLISIYNGFQMVEGSLCGYGNRSGISPLEMLIPICRDKNIQIGSVPLDVNLLCEAAQLAETVFMQVPNVFRPVSGKFVKKANFGVLNIPDFLGADGDRDYFLNAVNIHPNTIKKALEGNGFDDYVNNDIFIEDVGARLKAIIEQRYKEQIGDYDRITSDMLAFYHKAQLTRSNLIEIASNIAFENFRLQ